MSNILRQITALEAQLSQISYAEEVRAVIYAENKAEMMDVASEMKLHLFKPFETERTQDYYFFDYKLKNKHSVTISVRSKQQYVKKFSLTELIN